MGHPEVVSHPDKHSQTDISQATRGNVGKTIAARGRCVLRLRCKRRRVWSHRDHIS